MTSEPPLKCIKLSLTSDEQEEHYFLYFGSVFLWCTVKDASGIAMPPPASFKKAIQKDIQALRQASFLTTGSWSITGNFGVLIIQMCGSMNMVPM